MFRCVIFLKLFRFRVEPISDDRHDHPLKRREDALLKIHNRNEPELRIAEINAGHAIADLLRFLLVLPRHHRDDGDVTIGRGKLLPIHVVERERIGISRTQLSRPGRRGGEKGNAEKILKRTGEHAQTR
jgi:hypothetical protein